MGKKMIEIEEEEEIMCKICHEKATHVFCSFDKMLEQNRDMRTRDDYIVSKSIDYPHAITTNKNGVRICFSCLAKLIKNIKGR